MLSFEERRPWGNLRIPFQYLKGDYNRALTRACRDRTRGNGLKVKESRFRLNIRKNSLF